MLSSLFEQHKQNQRDFKKSQEQKRIEAISAAGDLIQAIKDNLHEGVKTAEINHTHIEQKLRILVLTLFKFKKKNKKFLYDLRIFTTSLKELGDVEHWASVMEKQLLEINFELDNLQVLQENV